MNSETITQPQKAAASGVVKVKKVLISSFRKNRKFYRKPKGSNNAVLEKKDENEDETKGSKVLGKEQKDSTYLKYDEECGSFMPSNPSINTDDVENVSTNSNVNDQSVSISVGKELSVNDGFISSKSKIQRFSSFRRKLSGNKAKESIKFSLKKSTSNEELCKMSEVQSQIDHPIFDKDMKVDTEVNDDSSEISNSESFYSLCTTSSENDMKRSVPQLCDIFPQSSSCSSSTNTESSFIRKSGNYSGDSISSSNNSRSASSHSLADGQDCMIQANIPDVKDHNLTITSEEDLIPTLDVEFHRPQSDNHRDLELKYMKSNTSNLLDAETSLINSSSSSTPTGTPFLEEVMSIPSMHENENVVKKVEHPHHPRKIFPEKLPRDIYSIFLDPSPKNEQFLKNNAGADLADESNKIDVTLIASNNTVLPFSDCINNLGYPRKHDKKRPLCSPNTSTPNTKYTESSLQRQYCNAGSSCASTSSISDNEANEIRVTSFDQTHPATKKFDYAKSQKSLGSKGMLPLLDLLVDDISVRRDDQLSRSVGITALPS